MSATSTRTPRTVEDGGGARAGVAGERLAAVTSGVWATLQGVVLSYAVVMLLSVVAVLGGPQATGAAWTSGFGAATVLWLLGHGVALEAGGAVVTLVPLGIGALAVFTCYVAVKRSTVPTLAAWLAATATYALTTGTLTAVATGAAAAGGEVGGEVGRWALAALGGAVVGGLGAAGGILVPPDRPTFVVPGGRLDRVVPDVMRLGVRAAVVALALLVAAGGVVTIVWVVAGRATSDDIVTGLDPGWIGGFVLAVAQLALLPNLVLWATAWLAGPGFAVGQGTVFSAGGTDAGPLPAVPLLGALPGPDWVSPAAVVAGPVVVVVCGAVAGWFAWTRLDPGRVRWADVAWVLAGLVLAVGAATALLQWWAGGAVGAARLSEVGGDPLRLAAVVAAEVGVGAALVLASARAGLTGRLRRR
ncbi:DUF6350 family protein [Isoptericola sp. NEAU-Y5]|uniref:DUF6350 family protein n=1 Tax=Isoptericola luteus TaxID=2879484 RepID=A0ABS7ZBY3_9MICO|nr:DUF6350 family protein [Isoptericola sp. NEAU-Y5]MCA5892561.1 DUF6350 family protein [Isoptericola sp. NEAU-Y5]